MWVWLIVCCIGYTLGSLPFAVWVARYHGVDIFKVGSGNPGATNVKRVLGAKSGNGVFLLDFLKGFLATGWPLFIFSQSSHAEPYAIAGLCAAIFGHSFSVFLKFRGGKGVATTMGGLCVLMPIVFLLGVVVWLAIFFLTRIVSLASLLFAISLPVFAYCVHSSHEIIAFCLFLMVLIIVRHWKNIVRLWNGTENRFERKP